MSAGDQSSTSPYNLRNYSVQSVYSLQMNSLEGAVERKSRKQCLQWRKFFIGRIWLFFTHEVFFIDLPRIDPVTHILFVCLLHAGDTFRILCIYLISRSSTSILKLSFTTIQYQMCCLRLKHACSCTSTWTCTYIVVQKKAYKAALELRSISFDPLTLYPETPELASACKGCREGAYIVVPLIRRHHSGWGSEYLKFSLMIFDAVMLENKRPIEEY